MDERRIWCHHSASLEFGEKGERFRQDKRTACWLGQNGVPYESIMHLVIEIQFQQDLPPYFMRQLSFSNKHAKIKMLSGQNKRFA